MKTNHVNVCDEPVIWKWAIPLETKHVRIFFINLCIRNSSFNNSKLIFKSFKFIKKPFYLGHTMLWHHTEVTDISIYFNLWRLRVSGYSSWIPVNMSPTWIPPPQACRAGVCQAMLAASSEVGMAVFSCSNLDLWLATPPSIQQPSVHMTVWVFSPLHAPLHASIHQSVPCQGGESVHRTPVRCQQDTVHSCC